MKVIQFSIIISILVLVGCDNQDDYPFKQRITLKTQKTQIQNMPLLPAGAEINVLKDYVVIYKMHVTNDIFDIFSRNKLKYLKSFGSIGGDSLQISISGFISKESNSNNIWINDSGRSHIRQYNIESIINSSMPTAVRTVRYPSDLVMLMHFYASVDNNKFYTQVFEGDGQLLASFNSDSENVTYLGVNKVYDDPIVLSDHFAQYQFTYTKHPKKDLFACSYVNYDVLKIVDSTGNELSQTTGPLKIRLSYDSPDIAAYRRIKSTENYIYAEFVGREAINHEDHSINYAKEIHVFDWQGNPVCILDLGMRIVSFDLDLSNDRILIITDESEDNPIVSFGFSENMIDE